MSFARPLITQLGVTALALLLLAVPSLAQDYEWAAPEYLDWADRSELPSNGRLIVSRANIVEEPCCTQANHPTLYGTKDGSLKAEADEESRTEADLLTRLAGHVSRDDKILRLGLDGGRVLKITDCLDDEDVCGPGQTTTNFHRLLAWWPDSRHYLVSFHMVGWSLVFLISQKDGRTTPILRLPILSPSGRYGIAVWSTPVMSVQMQIVDRATDPPKVVSVGRIRCAGFGRRIAMPELALVRPSPVWVDDSHVRFEGTPPWPRVDLDTKQLLNVAGARPTWEC